MPLFDPQLHENFDDDGAVLHHELAHAAVWFLHGGGVGRLRLTRQANGTLAAGVVTGERVAYQPEDDEYIDSAAERILAGEVASRRWLGLPQDRVSVGGCSFLVTNRTPVERVVRLCRDPREDIARVLVLAAQRSSITWFDWIAERLARARELVGTSWPVIAACARSYARALPHAPRPHVIWGTDLIANLRTHGLRPLDPLKPAVELLKRGESGDPFVWVRRWLRSFGRDGTAWRYRTAPVEEDRASVRSRSISAGIR